MWYLWIWRSHITRLYGMLCGRYSKPMKQVGKLLRAYVRISDKMGILLGRISTTTRCVMSMVVLYLHV